MGSQITSMSARWLPAYAAPILVSRTYAEIWGPLGATKIAGPLRVTKGSVTIDRANSIRRMASDVTFLPDAAGALMPLVNETGQLYPVGNEVHLFKGCQYSDGSTEYAKLGAFLLEETDVVNDATGVSLVGTLKDRGQTISRAKFTAPYSTDGTSTGDVAIQAVLSQQVPGLNYAFTLSAVVPPVSTAAVGDDPWKFAQGIAAGIGMELFADWNGTIVLQPIVNPKSIAPCTSYLEGTAAAPTTITRKISNATVPNVIVGIASGPGISTPLQTFWWDNNTASKTFYALGTPGTTLPARDPASTYPTTIGTINTSIPTTIGQLQTVVNAAGLGFIGTFEGIVFTIRDQPAHDVNDVVDLGRVVAGIPTGTPYIFDQVAIDLGVKTPLSVTGRLVV